MILGCLTRKKDKIGYETGFVGRDELTLPIDLDRFSLRPIKPKVGFFKDLPRGLDFALLCFSELFKSVPPTIVGSLTLLSAQVATEKTPP